MIDGLFVVQVACDPSLEGGSIGRHPRALLAALDQSKRLPRTADTGNSFASVALQHSFISLHGPCAVTS